MSFDSMKIGIYRHGIKCELNNEHKISEQLPDEMKKNERGKIGLFTSKSKSRLSWLYSQVDWQSMVTLTYHKGFPEYEESKQDLNVCLQTIRRMRIRYLWVVEFQRRGYPHYHIWLNRELDKTERERIFKSWLIRTSKYNSDDKAWKFHLHERNYTKWDVKLNLNYAVKYAEKQQQKYLPIGCDSIGRWWGASKNIIEPEETYTFDYENSSLIRRKVSNQFRRNVKRAIYHWSKRKKKNRFDKATNQGFTYILNDSRKNSIKKLFDYYKKTLEKEDSELYC
jgi:hypothetical protein